MLRCMELRAYDPVPVRPGAAKDEVDEAADFEALAYGATLGLVYFRALTPPLRDRWEQKMVQRVTQLNRDLMVATSANRENFATANGGFAPPSSTQYQNWRASTLKDQAIRKQVEFLSALLYCKGRVFPQNSDGAVNEDVKVGQYPWCQSDSEFEQVVAGELTVSRPNPQPVVPRGFGTEVVEDKAAGKILNTVLTSKSSQFIDKLLEIGEEHIAERLSKGVSTAGLYVVRKVPLADLIIDGIKDKIAGNSLEALVTRYRLDRARRLFLKQLSWGTYEDPKTPRPPSAADFSRQVMR